MTLESDVRKLEERMGRSIEGQRVMGYDPELGRFRELTPEEEREALDRGQSLIPVREPPGIDLDEWRAKRRQRLQQLEDLREPGGVA